MPIELAPGIDRAELERTSVLQGLEDRERWLRAHALAGLSD